MNIDIEKVARTLVAPAQASMQSKLFTSATVRLTLSYLSIIMLMSIGFSIVFYNTSARALDNQMVPSTLFQGRGFFGIEGARPVINEFITEQISESRHVLLERLIAVNLLTLVVGAFISYYLARRTLEPIEQNMEAQAQFVSDASHELRTPLTALQTMNEVALRRKNISAIEAQDIFKQNIEEVTKLKSLTDSLLRLTRHTEVAAQLAPVALPAITTEAVNQVIDAAVAKHISLKDTVANIRVLADMQNLPQAVAIVLDNAVKYSPAKSTIYLKGFQKGSYGIITIHDEGPGIAPADLPRIFDRFYRADQSRTKQKVEGHGIGLALAQKIVDQHDGEISASSTLGKGATFTIKVPLAPKAPKSSHES